MKPLLIYDEGALRDDHVEELRTKHGYLCVPKRRGWDVHVEGTELRDQFAMAALTGLLIGDKYENVVELAYGLADSMLEERTKQKAKAA